MEDWVTNIDRILYNSQNFITASYMESLMDLIPILSNVMEVFETYMLETPKEL